MKKLLQSIVLTMISIALFLGMNISADAMSKEEKEMFDSLGVEYSVDKNSELPEFKVSESDERISQEVLLNLAEKYKDVKSVGNYYIDVVLDKVSGNVSVTFSSKDGKSMFMSNGYSTIYVNPDQSFLALHYDTNFADEAASYCKGSMILNENGFNSFEEYVRNDTGNYEIKYKRDDNVQYNYNEKGELVNYKDYTTGIRYDQAGTPIRKQVKTDGYGGGDIEVPYSVADEIQAVLDKNGGKFYQKVRGSEEENIDNSQRQTGDWVAVVPEIDEILSDAYRAEKMELDFDVYRERKENYEKYAEEVGCVSLDAKAKIFGVSKDKLWMTPPKELDELPNTISVEGITEEFIKLINNHREANGLEPLDFSDSLLQQVADIRAQESTLVMDCAHSRPMAGNAKGFNVGENLALVPFSIDMTSAQIAQELFNAWKASKSHNDNMLTKEYTQGALGIKILDGCIYASNDFSVKNYQENANDNILRMIEIGAQVPSNVESTKDYYRRLLGGANTVIGNQETGEFEQSDYYVEDKENGGHIITGDLQVLDGDGNRFQLPNGKEWVNAWFGNDVHESVIYDQNGNEHKTMFGRLVFSCTDGSISAIYIIDGFVNIQVSPPLDIYYTNTNYPNDTIILMQYPDRTLKHVFTGGYDTEMYASEHCYFIANGDIIEYTH